MSVEYKSIDGFPRYRIGSDGSIWSSTPRRKDRPWKRLNPSRRGANKYLCVDLRNNGAKRRVYVHVLVLEAFVGPRPDGMEACHGPNGKDDNSVSNLRWGTHRENIQDKIRDKTLAKGTRHGMSKLHPSNAVEIRQMYVKFVPQEEIARVFGVSQATVWSICHNKTWRGAMV